MNSYVNRELIFPRDRDFDKKLCVIREFENMNVIPTTNYTGQVIEIQRFRDSDKIGLVLLFLSVSVSCVFLCSYDDPTGGGGRTHNFFGRGCSHLVSCIRPKRGRYGAESESKQK